MNKRQDQVRLMAHLRPLNRCRTCNKPATEELYTGLNDPVATYCSVHAKSALKKYKEGKL